MVQVAKCGDFRFLAEHKVASKLASPEHLDSQSSDSCIKSSKIWTERWAEMRLIKKSISRVGATIRDQFQPSTVYLLQFCGSEKSNLTAPPAPPPSSSTCLKQRNFEIGKKDEEWIWMDHCSPNSRDWMQCFGFHVGLTMGFCVIRNSKFCCSMPAPAERLHGLWRRQWRGSIWSFANE